VRIRSRSRGLALLVGGALACSGSTSGDTTHDAGKDAADAHGPCALAKDSGALLRVNQVGYRPTDPKHARLMSASALPSTATFTVTDGSCNTLLEGRLGTDLGRVNASFPHVYDVDASSLTTTGAFDLAVVSGTTTASARLVVGSGSALYRPLVANALVFYEAQRDGPDVDTSVLSRKASHLADATASLYETPSYKDDTLQAPLVLIPGPTVDVSGGWFDAGDYLKFVETASYTVAIMLLAVRDHPSDLGVGGVADFSDEARFGLTWLAKMYDEKTGALLYQVGLGDGNADGSILGDHDLWRLPQADDAMNVKPGDPAYFVRDRPVFRIGAAGSPLSPNLAGRLAADFALCAQVYVEADATLATSCLLAAEHVFALADASPGKLVTAAPYDYYPEVEWRDDLELGAAEIGLALHGFGTLPEGLPETDPGFYVTAAARWAHAYITGPNDGADSLNLYDVSALAHTELAHLMTLPGAPSGLDVRKSDLTDDLATQLEAGRSYVLPPFDTYDPNQGDSTPHALGLALTAAFYEELTGDASYSAFAVLQRDGVLGANPWGTSFIVGAGEVFPDCMQHQVANLSGSLDGTPPLVLGAVVDGPSIPSELQGLGFVDGMRRCPPSRKDGFAGWNLEKAAYEDNVVSWPSVEPADDYTALTILLFEAR
jgi:endoglucanase